MLAPDRNLQYGNLYHYTKNILQLKSLKKPYTVQSYSSYIFYGMQCLVLVLPTERINTCKCAFNNLH